jgi:hypothetical protein
MEDLPGHAKHRLVLSGTKNNSPTNNRAASKETCGSKTGNSMRSNYRAIVAISTLQSWAAA